MTDDFSDILDHPHYVSRTRQRMPQAARAAQFSAFAALTGYDEDIGEAARLTDAREDMSEDELAALDAAFQQLLAHAAGRPCVTLVYFQPDARKEGGCYAVFTGRFRHYDPAARMLFFVGGMQIPADAVCRILPAEHM